VAGGLSGFVFTLFFAIRGSRRQQTFLDRIAQSAEVLRHPPTAAILFGLTLLCWSAEILMVLCCLAAVGLPLTASVSILVLLAVNLGLILQVTPGNLGPFEASALIALAALGIAGPKALAFAVLYHFVIAVPITLAGLEGIRLVSAARQLEQAGSALEEPASRPTSP
jgi:glycosyltransferase AglD